MSILFRDYLDAKFELDERSLNPEVRATCLAALRDRPALTCLDLGTGAGASLRRLLNAGLAGDLDITAVDRDQELLDLACRRTAAELRAGGFETTVLPAALRARLGRRHIAIRFVAADLQHFEPGRTEQYDAVIAHAVMDLLPPEPMAERIAGWLKPRGVVYATLNYDGGTSLFPLYREPDLDERILAAYDASMERRRVWGRASGGARSGRRLHAALRQAGLEPLAYGSSDWSLTPRHRAYRGREALCLTRLLDWIREEAERSGEFAGADLADWYGERLGQIETGELGLIVHQLDLLAERPGTATS